MASPLKQLASCSPSFPPACPSLPSLQIAALKSEIADLDGFLAKLDDAAFALEMVAEGGAGDEAAELTAQALSGLAALEAGLGRYEARSLLAGPHDACDAQLTIQAGAGGVEAMVSCPPADGLIE